MNSSALSPWQSIGLNLIGGLLAYPLASGVDLTLDSFAQVPAAVSTTVFVTAYSGLVIVFIVRIWGDVKALTSDLKIVIIVDEQNNIPAATNPAQLQPLLFDEETFENFKRMLAGFPHEYTVEKMNRLYFVEALPFLPTLGLQELVRNPAAFAQLLGRLRAEDFVRTDGFSFSVQLNRWDAKRKEIGAIGSELHRWQEVASNLISRNRKN